MVDCSGLESLSGNTQGTAENAQICGLADTQDAMFAEGSAASDGAQVGTLPPVPWNPNLCPSMDGEYEPRLRGWREGVRKWLLRKGPQDKDTGESRRFPSDSQLYFVQAHTGEIKIGSAKDVARRMQTLQVSAPYPLKLLCAAIGMGSREREYHARFADHRIQGEWFRPHPDILAEIERLSQ